MLICMVTGMAVSTVKDPRLTGYKLLVCKELKPASQSGGVLLAADLIGAGEGDVVAVLTGAPAMMAAGDKPVDAAIIGILDEVSAEGWNVKGKQSGR